MDPTVAGALIGVGAAFVGFGASAWQSRATLRANRQAAQDQRPWEKRSTLYEEMLAAIATPNEFEPGALTWTFLRLADKLSEFEPRATACASDWVTSRYAEAKTSVILFPRELFGRDLGGHEKLAEVERLAEIEEHVIASEDGADRFSNAATGVMGALGNLRGAMRDELLAEGSRSVLRRPGHHRAVRRSAPGQAASFAVWGRSHDRNDRRSGVC